MKKIVIIGSPGAGKTTFARKLALILEIKIFHLDHYFWQRNWKEYSREERMQIEQDLMKDKTEWIIEGSYIGSADNRLKAADTIIFLDMPFSLCLRRVIARHIKYHGYGRPDIPDGCTDRISPTSALKIFLFPFKGRRVLYEKFETLRAHEMAFLPEKEIIILSSPEEVEDFLRRQKVKAWRKKYASSSHQLMH